MKENRRKLVGRVTSDKMDKTVVVAGARVTRHRLYGKVVRRASSFKAHDETNEAKEGDLVRIVESRPLSRDKRWVVAAILRKSGE